MKQWGVDVILVEPGNFNAGTGILTVDKVRTQIEGMWSSMNDEVKSAYGEQSLKTLFSRWAQKEIEGDDDISTEKKKSDSEYKKQEDDIETDSNNNIELPKSPDITPVIDALSSAVIQQWPYACYRPMDIRLRLKQAIAQHMPYSVFEAIYYTR
ncbi:unnamed protein product [Meganyctiphanes norvegica]|uniref:Uncharacterized protein n=1 Tax=Meganyctiphanes norvegica TaxID=48144 RepID=A0AAV2RIK8_MEGNR